MKLIFNLVCSSWQFASLVPGASVLIKKVCLGQAVPLALPPVPQVPLRLYGSKALRYLKSEF